MYLTASEIAHILNLSSEDNPKWHKPLLTVDIDSRNVTTGSLFACLQGENTDGHNFAVNAEAAGAGAIIAQRPVSGLQVPCLVVEDVLKALGKLASAWREKTKARVICVTGTAGKTTLRDTLAAVLAEKGQTVATKKNHNNQLGLPLSILATNGKECFWVMEAGISKKGDMDDLGQIIKPDLAVILNVGDGHCQGLGEMGVAWNKARLLNYVAKDGLAVISADYPQLLAESNKYTIAKILFSTSKNADFNIIHANLAKGEYLINASGDSWKIKTPFTGVYGAELSVATTAVAKILGLSQQQIAAGFTKVKSPAQRFNHITLDTWEIFDDTYNANPLSMARMLEAIKLEAGPDNDIILVLGEMGELGKDAAGLHYELGKQLAQIAPKAIFWKGNYSEDVQHGLNELGGHSPIICCEKPDDFVDHLKSCHYASDKKYILFKGSRANRLETFLESFKNMQKEQKENNAL